MFDPPSVVRLALILAVVLSAAPAVEAVILAKATGGAKVLNLVIPSP